MIVALTGWRRWGDAAFICTYLNVLRTTYPDMRLRHGDAPGADEIAWQWRLRHGVDGHRYLADRRSGGEFVSPDAGPRRNRAMLLGAEENLVKADILVAFPQPGIKGRSPGSGSWGCIIEAHFQRIHVEIPPYEGRMFG